MFTGIIEEVGIVSALPEKVGQNSELKVDCESIQKDLKIGDSLAVNGVCLTITTFEAKSVTADLSPETLAGTLFSDMKRGSRVNLELALRINDRLGGHMVLGHVDALAGLLGIQKKGDFYEFEFSIDPAIRRYLVHKGSVGVNGISLTLSKVTEHSFFIAVIPHTFHNTSLSDLKVGDRVHIETDIIARYVEGLLSDRDSKQGKKPIDLEFLQKHGFDS